MSSGDSRQQTKPATTRSLVDIALNLHRSTVAGMQQWSLGDLTFGLYLLSLRHATEMASDTVKGEKVTSPTVVRFKFVVIGSSANFYCFKYSKRLGFCFGDATY